MGRPRNFDENVVLEQASIVFARLGYNATSVDDLVTATGLQRGSLYKAFGSKKNLFEKVLTQALSDDWHTSTQSIDLLTTALKDLAGDEMPITMICHGAIADCQADVARILGERLLEHLRNNPTTGAQPP